MAREILNVRVCPGHIIMYEYVCMNIDCCLNIGVRVPSSIAGSLSAIMAQISTIADCGCFYFCSLLRQTN